MAALRGVVLASPEKGAGAVCAALTSGDPALESIALQLVPEVSGAAATEPFAQCLAKVPLPVQTLLLGALAVRGDAAARGAVEVAASSADRAARLAALNALGTLGNEATVKMLVSRTGTERKRRNVRPRGTASCGCGRPVSMRCSAGCSRRPAPERKPG